MSQIGVMHLTDTLDAGGAERVAVNLVNLLPRDRYHLHLCTTRRDGALAELVADDVAWLRLGRKSRFDAEAIGRLRGYIRRHDVRIIHAHGTSLFIAVLANLPRPRPLIVWHDHYGRYKFDDRPAWLYALAAKRIDGVIAVNQALLEWACRRLKMPARRVWYVPNFVCEGPRRNEPAALPGRTGGRIICVANFRPEKDHLTLIRAMKIVAQGAPEAHLLLVGSENDASYLAAVRREIAASGLTERVTILGQRRDVADLLRACDIGVLSSASEGLPLALLEYGRAGLAAVATGVGQCPEVLDHGRAGALVSPGSPGELATALLSLLRSPEARRESGAAARRRVLELYSPEAVIRQICQVYGTVAAGGNMTAEVV